MYDLAHPMSPSMPVYPKHVPYSITLNRRHGDPHDKPREDGSSFANEVIVMPGHISTHIDALGHFSRHGCVFGGQRASDVETHRGLASPSAAEEIKPIWRQAVLLDVATHRGVAAPWNRAARSTPRNWRRWPRPRARPCRRRHGVGQDRLGLALERPAGHNGIGGGGFPGHARMAPNG